MIQTLAGYTWKGAQTVIERFIDLSILSPKDKDAKYGQSYLYHDYIDIFSENL